MRVKFRIHTHTELSYTDRHFSRVTFPSNSIISRVFSTVLASVNWNKRQCLFDCAECFLNLTEHFIGGGKGDYGAALVLIVVDDRLGVLVEGAQALLDGLLIVVDAAGSLGAMQEALDHHLVGHFEVQHLGTRQNL